MSTQDEIQQLKLFLIRIPLQTINDKILQKDCFAAAEHVTRTF